VRDALDGLIRDATLVTIALGIAFGWALFQVAEGVSTLVATLLTRYPEPGELFDLTRDQPLSWDVGGRVVTLWPLVEGLIQLAVVLGVAVVLRRRDIAKPS
jgi:hypothetical protein